MSLSSLCAVIIGLLCVLAEATERHETAAISVHHNGVDYLVFADRMNTVVAMKQKEKHTLWTRAIPAVWLPLTKASGKPIDQNIARIEISGDSLSTVTELGSSFDIRLKDGAIKQAGSMVLERETLMTLNHPVDEVNCIEYWLEGLTVRFAKDDVRRTALKRSNNSAPELLDFLQQRGIEQTRTIRFSKRHMNAFFEQEKSYFEIDNEHDKLLWSNYLELERTFADLMSSGECQIDSGTRGEKIDRLAILYWDWVGCGGRCRQSGRTICTADYTRVITKTTDSFDD
jgi:hypothetical protein